MRFFAVLFLEQLIERCSGVCRRAGRGLALNDGSWDEQLARVAGLLVNYARRDWLAALEVGARIEISALTTGVQVAFAVGTGAYESDVCRRFCSAVGAFDRLAKRHHFGRARAFAIDGL
jgi:hypothetical protein